MASSKLILALAAAASLAAFACGARSSSLRFGEGDGGAGGAGGAGGDMWNDVAVSSGGGASDVGVGPGTTTASSGTGPGTGTATSSGVGASSTATVGPGGVGSTSSVGTGPGDCLACTVSQCPSAVSCLNDVKCLSGSICAVQNCLPGGVPNLPCALGCFDGDVGTALQAIDAIMCIFGNCSAECNGLFDEP